MCRADCRCVWMEMCVYGPDCRADRGCQLEVWMDGGMCITGWIVGAGWIVRLQVGTEDSSIEI